MIKIVNAYENNLKNISLEIPKYKITSIIGVSGSGKSTLIYKVIANESNRREKIDSGKINCLDYSVRAKFDKIENLPYSITLKQRGIGQAISSTIATVTNLHENLRSEFVKHGEIIGDNGNSIKMPDDISIQDFIKKYHHADELKFFAVVSDDKHTDGKKELQVLKLNNIKSAIFISSFDNKENVKKVLTVKKLNAKYSHTILVQFQNIEDISNFKKIAIDSYRITGDKVDYRFNIDFFDISTGKIYQKKSSQLLSFNATSSLSGKCQDCNGHGLIEKISKDKLFHKNKKLKEDFVNISLTNQGRYKDIILLSKTLEKELNKHNIDLNNTFFELSPYDKSVITNILFPKIFTHKKKPSIGKFVNTIKCPLCCGSILNYKANSVKLYGLSIGEFLEKSINDMVTFLSDKKLYRNEILIILKFLQEATLGYLSLDRTTDTLSGGELQRLKFAIELNSQYKGLLYILDEPSTGLHSYNNQQMINLIKKIRDKGNTVLISEHNKEYIKNSDYIVELGYGAGKNGGEIIFRGTNKIFTESNYSRRRIAIDFKNCLEFKSVNCNNIIDENFVIPLNCLVAISGVSGSGKSSLIHHVIVPTIKQYIADKSINTNLVKEAKNIHKINAIIELTQTQIGINSRSIVATYLNIFDKIREIYFSLDLSKIFGLDKASFSFNSVNGACTSCSGLGEIDELLCPSCLGNRYKPEILDIKYKNLNIIDLLNTPLNELEGIFPDQKLKFTFNILDNLGLSYLTLGRTTPTLSGGEAQRLKLAKILTESYTKLKNGGFLFVLDEPTSGLSHKDVFNIYNILDELLSYNNSVLIIEHDLEIIKNSDYIIDFGIGSGKEGGKNIFSGSFDDLITHKSSLTAKALRDEFKAIKHIDIANTDLTEKIYSNVRTPNCNHFYFNDNHFQIEKSYVKNCIVSTDSHLHKYFKTKENLFNYLNDFLADKQDYTIHFNPYVAELFTYQVVPITLKKEKISHMKKLGFSVNPKDYNLNEWHFKIQTNSLENAYNFGNGWLTIIHNNCTHDFFTRLVSTEKKVIGSPKIEESTFNLYLNSCIYCEGSKTKEAYDINIIIKDFNKSILDKGFFKFTYKRSFKRVVNKFRQEGLFDFSQPFFQLTEKEKNIFLFGFKEYKFLKNNGNTSKLSDYNEWKGLYSYIYHSLTQIKIEKEIRDSQHTEICPFCKYGFKREIDFYLLDNKSISHYLE